MRPVSDGSLAAVVPQNSRTGARSNGDDFSTHLRRGRHSSSAPDAASSSDASAEKAAKASDTSASQQDPAVDPAADPAAGTNIDWLAAQMLAFKMKEPMQTVQADGSVTSSVKTTVVTLPRSTIEQGTATADGVPTLDPQTGLLVMKQAAGQVVDPNTATGASPETTVAPPDEAIDPIPAEPPVSVDPTAETPPTDVPIDPAQQDPTIVASDPVLDPAATDPATVDPTAVDPSLVDLAATDEVPVDVLPTDGGDILPPSDEGEGSSAAPGTGQTKSPVTSAGTQISFARASDHSSGSGAGQQGGDFAGNTQTDNSGADAKVAGATPAATTPGFMAPSVQIQLAVPADRQLAPSLGAEIASTAQGMSALDRVLQATDQAQSSTPVMKVLNVQLAPPDLGNVSMRLSLEGNLLEVHMSVDQGRTRSLIERERHVISESLAKVGYSVSSMTIEQTSASSQSNTSSAGQSFTSSNGYDGSSGNQPNGAGRFGASQGQGAQGLGFLDDDSGLPVVPARIPVNRGVFV